MREILCHFLCYIIMSLSYVSRVGDYIRPVVQKPEREHVHNSMRAIGHVQAEGCESEH